MALDDMISGSGDGTWGGHTVTVGGVTDPALTRADGLMISQWALTLAISASVCAPPVAPELVDVSRASVADDAVDAMYRARDRALVHLRSVLAHTPVEDGVEHDAERLAAEFIAAYGDHALEAEIATSTALAADLLRVVGRIRVAPGFARKAVEIGLASPSVAMRDAAVQAVENWEDRKLARLLSERTIEPLWLDEYRAAVCSAVLG